jgi:hypothetical protein
MIGKVLGDYVNKVISSSAGESMSSKISFFAEALGIKSSSSALNPKEGVSIVKGHLDQMKNNTFDPRHGIAAVNSKEGLVILDGSHRMNAAIQYALETKDSKYVIQLITNGNISTANKASEYGVHKVYKLPTLK